VGYSVSEEECFVAFYLVEFSVVILFLIFHFFDFIPTF
jgi:hypothetical protein